MKLACSPPRPLLLGDASVMLSTLFRGQKMSSDADNLTGVIHVDGCRARNLLQARHKHHVAGNYDDKAGTGGKRRVGDVESPACGRAETLGIVGQGVLCLGNANRKIPIAPI